MGAYWWEDEGTPGVGATGTVDVPTGTATMTGPRPPASLTATPQARGSRTRIIALPASDRRPSVSRITPVLPVNRPIPWKDSPQSLEGRKRFPGRNVAGPSFDAPRHPLPRRMRSRPCLCSCAWQHDDAHEQTVCRFPLVRRGRPSGHGRATPVRRRSLELLTSRSIACTARTTPSCGVWAALRIRPSWKADTTESTRNCPSRANSWSVDRPS